MRYVERELVFTVNPVHGKTTRRVVESRYDAPTEEEIAAHCAEIRAGWTDTERRSRWTGPKEEAPDVHEWGVHVRGGEIE